VAENLPVPDASQDCVVATLVLCSVTDPPRALSEVLRVLRPGGRLLIMEHVGAAHGTWTRWLQVGGCVCSDRVDGCLLVIRGIGIVKNMT